MPRPLLSFVRSPPAQLLADLLMIVEKSAYGTAAGSTLGTVNRAFNSVQMQLARYTTCPATLVQTIVEACEPARFSKGDYVVTMGELSGGIFFLTEGKCKLQVRGRREGGSPTACPSGKTSSAVHDGPPNMPQCTCPSGTSETALLACASGTSSAVDDRPPWSSLSRLGAFAASGVSSRDVLCDPGGRILWRSLGHP